MTISLSQKNVLILNDTLNSISLFIDKEITIEFLTFSFINIYKNSFII